MNRIGVNPGGRAKRPQLSNPKRGGLNNSSNKTSKLPRGTLLADVPEEVATLFAPNSICSVAECSICRTLLENYAASLVAEKACISPFDRLVAQDFIPQRELQGGTRFCRFCSLYKKRYEVLCYITKGLEQNIRYEALYDQLSLMDKVETKSVEWLLGDIREEIQEKQVRTRREVKDSLLSEAKRLTDLWDAQVEDLDTQIAHSIGDLQRRQAQDLAYTFDNLESEYSKKRPHFSSSLLELFSAEPRMCSAKAFSQALKVVDAGKKLEMVQTLRFQREIEREKSLKLSWKICQQTRQSNGIVDKMMRFRRREEANREIDRERLKGRVKTALSRLEKVQRQALVVMRAPFLQHIYRIRHVVETEAKKVSDKKKKQTLDADGNPIPGQQQHGNSSSSSSSGRPVLYEPPKTVSFRTRDIDDLGRPVRTITQCPECSSEAFYTLCMGNSMRGSIISAASDRKEIQNQGQGSSGKRAVSAGGHGQGSNGNGDDLNTTNITFPPDPDSGVNANTNDSTREGRPRTSDGTNQPSSSSSSRPKSAPNVNNSNPFNTSQYSNGSGAGGPKGPIHCDWCGVYCGQPIELELERDMPASVQRALDSTEFANVALSCPTLDNIISGPKEIPDVPPLGIKKKKASEASLSNLKAMLAKHDASNKKRVVAKCCSFKCMYNWNSKHSPVYLRSRRHLQIDLMQRQRKEVVTGGTNVTMPSVGDTLQGSGVALPNLAVDG